MYVLTQILPLKSEMGNFETLEAAIIYAESLWGEGMCLAFIVSSYDTPSKLEKVVYTYPKPTPASTPHFSRTVIDIQPSGCY